MRKNLIMALLGGALFVLASCGSTPPAQETPAPTAPAAAPAEQPAQPEPTPVANAGLTAEDEALIAEITKLREECIQAGAEQEAPEYLLQADKIAAKAKTEYDNKDLTTARKDGLTARDSYQALKTGLDAYNLRQNIISEGLDKDFQADLDAADSTGKAAIDAYTAGDIAGANTNAKAWLAACQTILSNGQSAGVRRVADTAAAARKRAVDAKADHAVKDEFHTADGLYQQAISAQQGQKFDDAIDKYTRAAAMFDDATEKAGEKRAAAEKALSEAEKKMTESDKTAQEAEQELFGTTGEGQNQ
jgi:hypothetical protein